MRNVVILLILAVAVTGCSQSLVSQGRQLVSEGEYQRGIDLLYAELDTNPQNADAWRQLGIAFYKQNEYDKALEAFKQANVIDPEANANLYMGLIYERREEYGLAVNAYRAALALEPSGDVENMVERHLEVLLARKMQKDVIVAIGQEAELKATDIPENTIAVIDFDNTYLPPELAPLAKGFAEMTANDLAKVEELKVIERLKVDALLNELKLSASQYTDPSTTPRLGRLLGSNNLVTGSLVGIGDEDIRINGVIVSTRDSVSEATEPTTDNLRQFFKLQKDFVFSVIDSLSITLTPEERAAIEEVPTESFVAFLAYSRGLELQSQGRYDDAQQQFQQAADVDAGFMEAGAAAKSAGDIAASGGDVDPGQFEAAVVEAAEALGDISLDGFQAAQIIDNGFINTINLLDEWGNPARGRVGELGGGLGTVLIRGDLDGQP